MDEMRKRLNSSFSTLHSERLGSSLKTFTEQFEYVFLMLPRTKNILMCLLLISPFCNSFGAREGE